MAIDAATAAFLDSFNFTGGYPDGNADLVPSIIFSILYLLALPVLFFRLVRPQDRTRVLIRPAIFVPVRIATFILRAVMSKNTYGEGELVAELVLVSVGFLFLISPVITMWSHHVASCAPKAEQPGWVRRLDLILQLVLVATIALSIAGASLISSASSGGTSTSTVQALRKASYILSLVVVVLTLGAILVTHRRFHLDARGTLALLVLALLLLVVAVYRVVQIYATDPSAPVRSTAAFWVLQVTFEFLALCALLAISIPRLFPGEGKLADDVPLNTRKESAQSAA
ncbi:hypothetical protein Q5752_005725 [Cryptotrichosporon argae]